ncbi:MAG: hypothetical protein PHE10_02075, partial [Kiritimatiellae bacterium]|nr:hypothetical protein [Kiritimatiellia bacterium]
RSDCVPNGLVGYTAWAHSLLTYSSYVPWGTGYTHEMPYLYLYTVEREGSGSVWQLDAYSGTNRFATGLGALYQFGSVTRESPAGAFPGMAFGATPTPDVQVIL